MLFKVGVPKRPKGTRRCGKKENLKVGGGEVVGRMIILIFLPNSVIRSSFNCSNIANMDTARIKLVLMPLQVYR